MGVVAFASNITVSKNCGMAMSITFSDGNTVQVTGFGGRDGNYAIMYGQAETPDGLKKVEVHLIKGESSNPAPAG